LSVRDELEIERLSALLGNAGEEEARPRYAEHDVRVRDGRHDAEDAWETTEAAAGGGGDDDDGVPTNGCVSRRSFEDDDSVSTMLQVINDLGGLEGIGDLDVDVGVRDSVTSVDIVGAKARAGLSVPQSPMRRSVESLGQISLDSDIWSDDPLDAYGNNSLDSISLDGVLSDAPDGHDQRPPPRVDLDKGASSQAVSRARVQQSASWRRSPLIFDK